MPGAVLYRSAKDLHGVAARRRQAPAWLQSSDKQNLRHPLQEFAEWGAESYSIFINYMHAPTVPLHPSLCLHP